MAPGTYVPNIRFVCYQPQTYELISLLRWIQDFHSYKLHHYISVSSVDNSTKLESLYTFIQQCYNSMLPLPWLQGHTVTCNTMVHSYFKEHSLSNAKVINGLLCYHGNEVTISNKCSPSIAAVSRNLCTQYEVGMSSNS